MSLKIYCFILALIFVIILSACHKDAYTPINNCFLGSCDTSKLELVWQRPLSTDTAELSSIFPLLYNGGVLFTRSTFGESTDTLKFFDAKSGLLKWRWFDYYNDGSRFGDLKAFLQDGKFFFNTVKDVYAVNAQSGTTVWKTQIVNGNGSPRLSVFDKYIFHVQSDWSNSPNLSTYLVRSDINAGHWDTIFTQPKIGNFEPDSELPSVWISPSGDSIALFQVRYYDYQARIGRIDFVAYNMTQKHIYFRFDNIDKDYTGSVVPCYVYNNKVYVAFFYSLYCFDLLTKQIKWSKETQSGESFTGGSPYLMADGKLYVKPDNRTLYALDPETGTETWSDHDNGSGGLDMIYNKGILYYTCRGSAQIIALDTKTNTKIWQEKSPNYYPNKLNGNRSFDNANIGYGGIAIDTTLGYLYTSDFYFAMCIKLPKQ